MTSRRIKRHISVGRVIEEDMTSYRRVSAELEQMHSIGYYDLEVLGLMSIRVTIFSSKSFNRLASCVAASTFLSKVSASVSAGKVVAP